MSDAISGIAHAVRHLPAALRGIKDNKRKSNMKLKDNIIWTKDYKDFKLLDYNRFEIKQAHVEKLKESMKKHGFLPQYAIIINTDFTIREGQHRFIAAKELDIEIPIVFSDTIDDELMLELNNTSLLWSKIDNIYLRAAKDNIPGNKKIIELYKEYKLSVDFLLKTAGRGVSSEFIVNDFNLKEAQDKLMHFFQVTALLRTDRKIKLGLGLLSLMGSPGYSKKHMLEQLRKYSTKAYPCISQLDYKEMLKTIYNYKTKTNKRI